MKELAYLNKYLIKYKRYLLLGILFITISNIFQILPAVLVRMSLDLVKENLSVFGAFSELKVQEIFESITNRNILLFAGLIISFAILRGFFLFLVRQTIIIMSRHIEYDLKNEIYYHYQQLPLSFYRRNNTGDLIARISEDVSKVRMYLGPAIMYGLNMMLLFIILLPIMISISPKLTLYSLTPLPFLSISIYFVNNIINKRSEEIQQALSNLSTFVQEAFSGIRVIKSFAREEESYERFVGESDVYKHRSLRLARVDSLFFPLIVTLIGLSTIITVWVGGAEVINGNLTVGNIAEFVLYVNILTWPVTALGWVTSIVQRAAASQKRINEFLLTNTDIVSRKNFENELQGAIKFNNVSFTYADSGITALKNISFDVKPGETLGIIGTTGSGKSTLANLLCRMYDTNDGEIIIDNKSIVDYNLYSLRSQIGYVPQEVFLFSDSISKNISFGNDTASPQEIERAAKDADLYSNITEFPEQFETVLGERGITLSGGQKQRLSIARAIVREPKILILDDCLSAVDTKTENRILNSLQKIMDKRTSIIISHRVSSAKLADKIIVLDDGKIIEEGTHEELLDMEGVYATLHTKQLQAEELLD